MAVEAIAGPAGMLAQHRIFALGVMFDQRPKPRIPRIARCHQRIPKQAPKAGSPQRTAAGRLQERYFVESQDPFQRRSDPFRTFLESRTQSERIAQLLSWPAAVPGTDGLAQVASKNMIAMRLSKCLWNRPSTLDRPI